MTPKFEPGQDFCTMHLPPKVSSSDAYSFGSYRVDKQTNKQTLLKTSNALCYAMISPSPLLDNIRVMVIVWRLRGNIIRTALCWIVWHNVHSPQHTYVSSSYRSNRLGLSHWDPYIVRRGGCLELYYCNMVEWFWWDSSLISTTNWFPSVLWHCWFGHLACKIVPEMTYNVSCGTLNPTHSLTRYAMTLGNKKSNDSAAEINLSSFLFLSLLFFFAFLLVHQLLSLLPFTPLLSLRLHHKTSK